MRGEEDKSSTNLTAEPARRQSLGKKQINQESRAPFEPEYEDLTKYSIYKKGAPYVVKASNGENRRLTKHEYLKLVGE